MIVIRQEKHSKTGIIPSKIFISTLYRLEQLSSGWLQFILSMAWNCLQQGSVTNLVINLTWSLSNLGSGLGLQSVHRYTDITEQTCINLPCSTSESGLWRNMCIRMRCLSSVTTQLCKSQPSAAPIQYVHLQPTVRPLVTLWNCRGG